MITKFEIVIILTLILTLYFFILSFFYTLNFKKTR